MISHRGPRRRSIHCRGSSPAHPCILHPRAAGTCGSSSIHWRWLRRFHCRLYCSAVRNWRRSVLHRRWPPHCPARISFSKQHFPRCGRWHGSSCRPPSAPPHPPRPNTNSRHARHDPRPPIAALWVYRPASTIRSSWGPCFWDRTRCIGLLPQ